MSWNHRKLVLLLGIAVLVGPLLIGLPDLNEHPGYVLLAWLGGITVSVLVVTRFSLLLQRAQSLANTADADLVERGRLLLESEDRYRQLVEQIPAVIYDIHVEQDGTVYWQYVSPQCATIFGIRRRISRPNSGLRSRALKSPHEPVS